MKSIEASIRYYVDGLGFKMTKHWSVEGKLQWCWLQLGGAALMLQEIGKAGAPAGTLGLGVSVCFQCKDALAIYREVTSRGIQANQPIVGNAMWVTSLCDPDGYKVDFESPTEAAEETESLEANG